MRFGPHDTDAELFVVQVVDVQNSYTLLNVFQSQQDIYMEYYYHRFGSGGKSLKKRNKDRAGAKECEAGNWDVNFECPNSVQEEPQFLLESIKVQFNRQVLNLKTVVSVLP